MAEMAESVLEREGPIPVELCRIIFIKIPILRDGTLNSKCYKSWVSATMEASKAKMLLSGGPQRDPVVKQGHAKPAGCRMPYKGSWEPTRADRKTLWAELARRDLPWGGGKGTWQWGA